MPGGDGADHVHLADLVGPVVAQPRVDALDLGCHGALGPEDRAVPGQVRADPEVRGAAAGERHEVARDARGEDRPRGQDDDEGDQDGGDGARRPRDGRDRDERDERDEEQVGAGEDGRREQQARDRPGRPGGSSHREHGRRERRGEQQRSQWLGQQIARRCHERRVERDEERGEQRRRGAGHEHDERERGDDGERAHGRLPGEGGRDRAVVGHGVPVDRVRQREQRGRARRPVHRVLLPVPAAAEEAVGAVVDDPAGDHRVRDRVPRVVRTGVSGGVEAECAAQHGDRDERGDRPSRQAAHPGQPTR